jgi:hypothetical protein
MDNKPLELREALQQFEDNNQKPDGFLYRIIVIAGEDLQPFSTSIYGLTVTNNLTLNRLSTNKDEVQYEIFDVVGFPKWEHMEAEMKSADKILNQIVKQSLENNYIRDVSLAVHFVDHPPEEVGWGSPSEDLPEINSEDEDLF